MTPRVIAATRAALTIVLPLSVSLALPLSLAVVAAPALTPPASAASTAAPPAARSSARPAPHHGGDPIDTWDRHAVATAYAHRWLPTQTVASGWTGRVDGCVAGHPSAAAQRASLTSVNFARALAGLEPVRYGRALSAQAQQAALVMTAQGVLSHTPTRDWACYDATAARAAGRSNLAMGLPTLAAGQATEVYLKDLGAGNEVAGHRRWLLDPRAVTFGHGMTLTTDAMYVEGRTSTRRTDPDWVSWPTPGWFPSPMEPGGRWSLASGDIHADFSHARVTVRSAGRGLPVRVYPATAGYAMPTLVFGVGGVRSTGTYRVSVTGIRHAAATSRRWTVRLLQP